jgi:DNA polymerase-3 subunit epsilon
MRNLYLDTETTGLSPARGARIVEVAISDDNGPVFESLVNPGSPIPPDATRIHGINDAMVADAPSLEALLPKIAEIVASADRVVIFNKGYDIAFFPDDFFAGKRVDCAMLRFAAFRASLGQGETWPKLAVAAKTIGYVWQGDAHRALADTLATGAVWRFLDDKFPMPENCSTTIAGYGGWAEKPNLRAGVEHAPEPQEPRRPQVALPSSPLRSGDGLFGLARTHRNLTDGRPAREGLKFLDDEVSEIFTAWQASPQPATIAALSKTLLRSPLSLALRLRAQIPHVPIADFGLATQGDGLIYVGPAPDLTPSPVVSPSPPPTIMEEKPAETLGDMFRSAMAI